jgi:hypothetical protein
VVAVAIAVAASKRNRNLTSLVGPENEAKTAEKNLIVRDPAHSKIRHWGRENGEISSSRLQGGNWYRAQHRKKRQIETVIKARRFEYIFLKSKILLH